MTRTDEEIEQATMILQGSFAEAVGALGSMDPLTLMISGALAFSEWLEGKEDGAVGGTIQAYYRNRARVLISRMGGDPSVPK